MTIPKSAIAAAALFAFVCAGAHAAGSGEVTKEPDVLAQKLQLALDKGDMDAELALFDTQTATADAQMADMDLVSDCFEDMTCHVSVAPLSDAFKARTEMYRTLGMDFTFAPAGLLRITLDAPGDHREEELPYAEVGGSLKIMTASLTPATISVLKAKTAQSQADQMLAHGALRDKASRNQAGDTRDKDWQKKASVLPPGGGEAGRAFNAFNKALTAAVKANDLDAVIALGPTEWKSVFGEKTSDSKPVSLRKRQLKLRAQAITFTVDTKVLAGYVLNDVYAIVYEGRNGAGWIVRGCAVGVLDDGKWVQLRTNDIAIPPR